MTITIDQMVQREVHYCVSGLVSTLAAMWGNVGAMTPRDAYDLAEQASELSAPIDDWEEAATQAGWTHETARFTGAPWFVHNDHGRHDYEGWQELCEDRDIEPYQWEVYEHWIVSDWLADRLIAHGEKVDKDFAGLTVWARTTTGQSIVIDAVIEKIYRELITG